MTEHRRLGVLKAIIQDYVRTGEPVGSKSVVENYGFGVSAATVRNDMAALEDDGYISAPHTSAGRIPTDKGYRAFVNQLATIRPLSSSERRAIRTFLEDADGPEDLMRNTVRLLAQLTHQVALIQYPRLSPVSLRHIELLSLSEDRLLMVLIASNGLVEQRHVVLDHSVSEEEVESLKALLIEWLVGSKIADLEPLVEAARAGLDEAIAPAFDAVIEELMAFVQAKRSDRIIMAGTANLARFSVDSAHTIAPILEALEEQVVLLRLLASMDTNSQTVSVSIGSENKNQHFSTASVVAGEYDLATGAKIGVLGPTRMDYANSISVVGTVAKHISRTLSPH